LRTAQTLHAPKSALRSLPIPHVPVRAAKAIAYGSIRKLKEIHTATHPGARLGRAKASPVASAAGANSGEDLAEASAPPSAAREELLSALAAEAAEEDSE
jgi:hypothetical protein